MPPPEGHVQSSQPRFGRVEVAARLEGGVNVEGLAPCADIVVAGGIGRVIDQRLELEGLSGGNLFELELPDVNCLVLCVDTAVPSEGVGVTTDGDPVAYVQLAADVSGYYVADTIGTYPVAPFPTANERAR